MICGVTINYTGCHKYAPFDPAFDQQNLNLIKLFFIKE